MYLTHSRLPPPWGADDLQAGQYRGLRVQSPEPRCEEIAYEGIQVQVFGQPRAKVWDFEFETS